MIAKNSKNYVIISSQMFLEEVKKKISPRYEKEMAEIYLNKLLCSVV